VGWTIGKYRVEVRENGVVLTVSLDDEPPRVLANARILGDYPLQIGKRDAVVRRVRNLDVARSELWIGDVCVPPSPDSLIQKLAPRGTFCEGAHPESFRTAAAPATYLCPTCRKLLCKRHVAIDRVRCPACFEEAGHAAALELRRIRIKGPLLGVGIGAVVALLGAGLGVPQMFGLGAGAMVLVVIKVTSGYLRERKEARLLKAPPDGG
jgi:hypothetical protein